MRNVQRPIQPSVEHLLAALKQLSPSELREFTRRFAEWEQQNGKQAENEATLLARIKRDSRLPITLQRRFNHLRRKRQAEKLTKSEAKELQEIWQHVEQMNAARLEALTELARLRGTDVRTLMRELGLSENHDVF
jgi:uncharacterized phage-associated protein